MTRIADDFAAIAARLRELEGPVASPPSIKQFDPNAAPVKKGGTPLPWNSPKKLGGDDDDDFTFFRPPTLTQVYERWLEEHKQRLEQER